MNAVLKGKIVKGIGGFYYVETETGLYECRARGVFRKQGRTPLVGDVVQIQVQPEQKGTVQEILPRKNALVRPPLANIDQLFLVTSLTEPVPNLLLLDKLIAIAERSGIEPVIVLTKCDLDDPGKLRAIYEKAGFAVYCVDNSSGQGADAVRAALRGKTSAFCGNSGVGKSSLLNCIDSRLGLPTGEISGKLGRGRHTTRHVELYPVEGGGYVADTPGFSSLDMERCEIIRKEELADCFREMRPYQYDCRFTGCAHVREKGCAVLAAVERGEIPASRHASYAALYEQAKNIKEWELK